MPAFVLGVVGSMVANVLQPIVLMLPTGKAKPAPARLPTPYYRPDVLGRPPVWMVPPSATGLAAKLAARRA